MERGRCFHRFILFEHLLSIQDRATFDYLLEVGFRVDLFDDEALFLVIAKGDEEIVRFLIEKGADPHLAGNTPGEEWDSHCGFFFDDSKRHSSVYTAILGGHTEICKMLVEEYGVRPDRENLDLAREKGNQEVIDILSGLSYDDVPEKWPISEKHFDICHNETHGSRFLTKLSRTIGKKDEKLWIRAPVLSRKRSIPCITSRR